MPAYYIGNKLKLMCGSRKIKKGLCAQRVIYSSGSICTYHVDTGVSYQEEVDSDASCLTPKTFTPQKTGWSFVGWREDTTAHANVLTSKVMKDDPITLYAVFQQTITLSYNGNGSTGGSTETQIGIRYCNGSGNIINPAFVLNSNGYTRSDGFFKKWALSSADGSQYDAGATITLTANTTMYAIWTGVEKSIQPLKNNFYLNDYDTHIDVNKHDAVLICDVDIDCSLYKGVQFTTEQILATNCHEGTGFTFGMYESAGGAFLPFLNISNDWVSVGGTQHTEMLVENGSTVTFHFANSTGITKLYLGYRQYNSTHAYGNAFFFIKWQDPYNGLKLIPR